jgi:hypothetical protein
MPIQEGTIESAEVLLRPYLSALLRLSTEPIPGDDAPAHHVFTTFYSEHPPPAIYPLSPLPNSLSTTPSPQLIDEQLPTVLVAPSFSPLISEASDAAAKAGDAFFRAAVSSLRARGIQPSAKNSSSVIADGDEVDDEDVWPSSVWPPLETEDDEDVW